MPLIDDIDERVLADDRRDNTRLIVVVAAGALVVALASGALMVGGSHASDDAVPAPRPTASAPGFLALA